LRTSFDYTNQNFTELYTALGGGVGLPGATTQVIFNDGGTNLAGDAGLTYNKTTDALTVAGLVTAGSAAITGALTVDTTTLVVDATLNRVGIGTASPNNTLQVGDGSADTRAYFFSNNDYSLAVGRSNAAIGGYIGSSGANIMIFMNGAGTERARMDSSGNMLVGVASANANGGVLQLKSGITFPATQVAATDVNTLDDYEEGTWTGTLKGSITDPTVAVTATGRYTKIGRQVFIDITFSNISNVGASGELSVTGLPFACNGSVNAFGSTSMNGIGTFAGGSPISIVVAGGTTLLFYGNVSGLPNVVVTHNPGTARYFNASISYSV
jgi:hypothetical protein